MLIEFCQRLKCLGDIQADGQRAGNNLGNHRHIQKTFSMENAKVRSGQERATREKETVTNPRPFLP